MTRKLNNAHLRDIADTVDPSGTTGAKMLNNEYLERIANGIGSITGIVDPSTGKIDSSMLEGVIDASNLPSYVDDVIEGYYHQGTFYSDSAHANAIMGETGKIYVDVPSGATYRWGGSAYAKVGGSDVEIATTQDAVTGTNDTKVMTPLKTKQAIDASGVPEMSPDVRGGAKLDADGGLALRDGALGIGTLVQESDGTVRGGIASLTAKGHAEQASTTGKNLVPQINETTASGITCLRNNDGSIVLNGTATTTQSFYSDSVTLSAGTYTLSGTSQGGSSSSYQLDVRVGSTIITGAIDYGNGATFTINESSTIRISARIASGYTCNNLTFYPQLELGSTATEYEPYSGGAPSPSPDYPQEIQVVRGRNLLGPLRQVTGVTVLGNSISFTGVNRDLFTGTTGADTSVADVSVLPHLGAGTYCLSYNKLDVVDLRISAVNDDGTINSVIIKQSKSGWQSYTFTLASPTYVTIRTSNTTVVDIQLELGSTATPYVPYGHVGMEVRGRNLIDTSTLERGYIDVSGSMHSGSAYRRTGFIPIKGGKRYILSMTSNSAVIYTAWYGKDKTAIASVSQRNQSSISIDLPANAAFIRVSLIADNADTYRLEIPPSTTPIPLPSRGWVGSLPDGTADVLRLDGAGKVEWELTDAETTTAATDGITGTVGVDVLSTTGQIADGTTVLYKLATPVTEQCAYADMPSIAGDATVTIRELDDLGIKYFIDDAVLEYGRQIYQRAHSEYADRLEALEATVANLVAGA